MDLRSIVFVGEIDQTSWKKLVDDSATAKFNRWLE